MIEVNSSFYRPPSFRTTESWVRRTEEHQEFFFTAKLHQDITHKGRLDDRLIGEIRQGFGPMVAAGKLKHLLAQFRYDFVATEQTGPYLRRIADSFRDMAEMTFELRHSSWQTPSALEFLEGLGVNVANLDYPMATNSFSMHACPVGQHGYLRLHGRNRAAWFSRGAGRDETYNYFYSGKELEGIRRRVGDLMSIKKSLTVVANNHYQGKEAANILQLKALTLNAKVLVPPVLVGKYPELARIAREPDASEQLGGLL